MSNWVLPADTLLSTLLPSGGGSLASGDTIDFNGHTLVMDCDAVDYPFTPLNVGGVPCKLELRDLSRIRLNASLPSTVSPWVDPGHPLPVSTPGVAEGVDGYVTGLTANARAEIQIAHNSDFGLGGGRANLPTETRSGNFWARVESSASSTTLKFDRDLPLHAGDYTRLSRFLKGLEPFRAQGPAGGRKTSGGFRGFCHNGSDNKPKDPPWERIY